MRAWSLFSGVGGFDLGLQRAGIEVTLACELDEWRRRVLAHHFPGVRLHDDVTTLHGTPGAAQVLCGGFPCQDLSVAGKRAGLAGTRSGLFFEFARIASELELAERGGWVFLENVPGLLSSNGGRDFGVVLQTLADLGFAVGYRVLDSRHFGVPQRRRRVFIVGHSRASCARAVLFDGEGGAGGVEPGRASGAEVAGTLGGGSGKRGWCDDFDRNGAYVVANTVEKKPRNQADHDTFVVPTAATLSSGTPKTSSQAGRRQEDDVNLVAFHTTQDPIHSHPPALGREESGCIAVAFSENQRAEVVETDYAHQLTTGGGKPGQGYPDGRVAHDVRRLTPIECERLQGFPDNWTAVDGEPVYAKAANGSWRCKEGTPDSRRYAAMGDAVTVNVIEWIARRMHTAHAP